jgi:hypothetical protein
MSRDKDKDEPIKTRGCCGDCNRWIVDAEGTLCDMGSKVPEDYAKRYFLPPWPRTDDDYGPCSFWRKRE